MKELERLPAPSRSYLVVPERKRQFVENMIMNDLLFQEGKQAGFDKDEEIERQVNDLRKRLVVQKVMRKYQTPPTISDEQVRAYYDGHPELYSTTQIRASHILVKDEPTATEILVEIRRQPGALRRARRAEVHGYDDAPSAAATSACSARAAWSPTSSASPSPSRRAR